MTTNGESPQKFNALAIGWYGAPNVGDEVLLEVLRSQISELGGSLTVVSADPELTRKMHGVDSVDFNNLGEIARALLWADVLVMGGGGIFQDHHPFRLQGVYDPALSDIAAYARPILMARQFGVPVVIWGHGVGPLRSAESREVVRDIFNGVAAASVRDQESLALLREIGVHRAVEVGPDPGWLYSQCCVVDGKTNSAPTAGSSKTKVLAIVVREWAKSDEWKRKLVSAINQSVTTGWSVQWIAFQADIGASGAVSDRAVIEELRQQVPEWARGQLLTPSKPQEAWSLLSGADAVFSMRLHASILGLLARKPVAGLEYDPKMAQLHVMAGTPPHLRIGLDDSEQRYIEAVSALLSLSDGNYQPNDERIVQLEEGAKVHLRILTGWNVGEDNQRRWISGHYDWIGTWLQQSLADLRATRAKSEYAHELLNYRDAMLSQKDADMAEARKREAQLSAELDVQRAIYRSQQENMEMLKKDLADLEERVGQVQAAFDEQSAMCARQQGYLEMQEKDLREQAEKMTSLVEKVRALEIELEENADEIRQKSAYIDEKEIYIAQLLLHKRKLEEELDSALRSVQRQKGRVRRLISVVRRDAIRVASAPFKLGKLWRQHGIRVTLQQARRRITTLGAAQLESEIEAPATVGMPPVARPVRSERLLVIATSLQEGGWLNRPAALTKAAARAGFFARIWQTGSEPGQTPDTPLASLLTDQAGIVHSACEDARILLADVSQLSIAVAKAAHEAGAEIILDLSSANFSDLDPERRSILESITSRAIARDPQPELPWERLTVDHVPDAADNEEFDSYRTYPYPEEYRKRRRNILLFAINNTQAIADELASALPHDQIHVVGGEVVGSKRVQEISWEPSRRASLLAAADVIIVANDGEPVSPTLRALVNAALLMERCVISDTQIDISPAKNFHLLERTAWVPAIELGASQEDYSFVSQNTWLGRAEQLMRAMFPPLVSVVVLIHNNCRIIERCISTMLGHCGEWLHEIVIVDNQSSDGGPELVSQLYGSHPKVKLVRNSENGCSSGRNLGVRHSTGKYIAFFDSDQWLTAPSCFAEALFLLETEPNIGAVGWNAGWFDATRDDLGGAISDYVPLRGMSAAAQAKGYRDDIGFLGTSGMFLSRKLFDAIEGFDTFYDPTCFEDTDICFQIKKAGFKVVLRDLAGVRHQPHQTTGASEGSERYRKLFNRNAKYFREKWSAYPHFFVDYTA